MTIPASTTSQIVPYIAHGLSFTAHSLAWIPNSSRLLVCGTTTLNTGVLTLFEITTGRTLKEITRAESQEGIKCITTLPNDIVVTGGVNGTICYWWFHLQQFIPLRLNRTRNANELKKVPEFVKGHSAIINCIDGIRVGAPEVVTGSKDGCVKVWDARQRNEAVITIAPQSDQPPRDCWSVAIGNSFGDERVIAAGYDNGDVKLFDLKSMTILWSSNLSNGVIIKGQLYVISIDHVFISDLQSSFRSRRHSHE